MIAGARRHVDLIKKEQITQEVPELGPITHLFGFSSSESNCQTDQEVTWLLSSVLLTLF